jgi:malic enzyme
MNYRMHQMTGGSWEVDVAQRGQALLLDPLLNKGTAFTAQERSQFGLEGMIPHQTTTRQEQARRAYEHIVAKGDNPLEKYVGMVSLQDRNETLFYQVMADHVAELIPIVYTPTVGEAAVGFSHLFRRGRGLWITPDHRGRIREVLGHARNEDVRLIVVTDNERILGLGDQGAGGMVIPVGKLSLYTLAAGIHPAVTLPISLDVGTDNQTLLEDELYVGWRQPRLRGKPYDEFVAEFVAAVKDRWPQALLQWEDFKKSNALALLDRYREELPSFNDDIQGTAAVVAAGVLSYCRATASKLADHRFVLVGAGAAGVGIARLLLHSLEGEGDPRRSLVLLDSAGLLTTERDGLEAYKRAVACPSEVARAYGIADGADLVEVVRSVRPTVLIGTSGQPGLFGPEVLATLAAAAERPLVMALSNPTSKTEATPAAIAAATDGRAFIATGSPFEPVAHGGRVVPVSQCNNVYVFPGVGLATIVTGARMVTDAMFAAAADELASQVHDDDLAAGWLYPPIADLRAITRQIARAVCVEATRSGAAAPMSGDEIDAALDTTIWNLDYPTLRPV